MNYYFLYSIEQCRVTYVITLLQALGNHEFDNGPRGLHPFLQSVNFPVVSANIDASMEPLINGLFSPSVIKNIEGEKIGIIGFTSKETPELATSGVDIFMFILVVVGSPTFFFFFSQLSATD